MKKRNKHNIGLMVQKRHQSYLLLNQLLGYKPSDYSLYRLALRHSSASLKGKDGTSINNERLEFIGDAVLNLIISDYLFKKYEHKQEGFLTNARAAVVNRDNLNELSLYLGIDKLIIANNVAEQIKNTHILGSTLEALIAAVFLDKGYDSCVNFVMEILKSYLELNPVFENISNYKSRLLEWCQTQQHHLEFKLLEELIVDKNEHIFTTQVFIDNIAYAVGKGNTKKKSQQKAAEYTLLLLNIMN